METRYTANYCGEDYELTDFHAVAIPDKPGKINVFFSMLYTEDLPDSGKLIVRSAKHPDIVLFSRPIKNLEKSRIGKKTAFKFEIKTAS